MSRDLQRVLADLLSPADIRLGGDRPWDLEVRDERFPARVLTRGSLGLGESYMDGWWECPRIDELICRILSARIDELVRPWRLIWPALQGFLFNLQKPSRAFEVGRRHYDIGNELYVRMLDRRMIYSCAYWGDGADDLDAAQEAKLELTCAKLGLRPGMRLLDVGCGWGGTLRYAAERYGVRGVGVTVSNEQVVLARRTCAGWPVEIRPQDYRELDEPFDRILSIGMFEHVGARNHRAFLQVARRCLAEDGLLLLHTIGHNRTAWANDPWIERYIFPNSLLPSVRQIAAASEGLFVLEDWHSFGADYDRTLMAWYARFEASWPELRDRYDDRFHRMWRYYLMSCAGSFRARTNQLWQVVLSPRGVPGGYRRPVIGSSPTVITVPNQGMSA